MRSFQDSDVEQYTTTIRDRKKPWYPIKKSWIWVACRFCLDHFWTCQRL